jgi:hypothetical protein
MVSPKTNSKSWDSLKRKKPDFLLDTARINAKYARRKDNPLRIRTGSFHLPKEMKGPTLVRAQDGATGAFVRAFEQRGWVLQDHVQLEGPFQAYTEARLPILDKYEWRCAGTFKGVQTQEEVRIELPPGIVRRDPEHEITLKEAIKAGS